MIELENTEEETGGFNSGLFALVVIVGVVFCCLGVGIVFYLQRRNKKRSDSEAEESKRNQERASIYKSAGGGE